MFPADPRPIAILLCTYQGQAFLAEQLDSFIAQTQRHWTLHVSDDGSTDATMAILADFAERVPGNRVHIEAGPRQGLTANFTALTQRADADAAYYAYADQDDIWEADKLERATTWLAQVDATTPALFCSRTRLMSEDGRDAGLSPLFRRAPSFANALAQNIAGGNTMVMNDAARRLMVRAAGAGAAPVIYDWWTYLLVTGCGGQVHYDPIPTLRYRQHQGNQVGANTRPGDRARNATRMLAGRLRRWNEMNLAALDCMAAHITPGNRRTLEAFRRARRRRFAPALIELYRSGVRRQTALGSAALFAAAAVGRL